jgi:hypothetical protein
VIIDETQKKPSATLIRLVNPSSRNVVSDPCVGSIKGGRGTKGNVMKKDPFWVLIGNAYDGLQDGGEVVTMKAGSAVYYWFYQNGSSGNRVGDFEGS